MAKPIFSKLLKFQKFFNILILFSVLSSNVLYPTIALAEELYEPIEENSVVVDTSEDILNEGIQTNIFEEEDIVEENISEYTFENGIYTVNVVETKEYVYPDNENVRIKFTNVTQEGNLVIKQVLLTEDEKIELNTSDDYAWDISSTMENGSFEYDLTLPNTQGNDIQVKYSEDGEDFANVNNILVNDSFVTVKGLDHFTRFVVINPLPTGISNGDICTISGISGTTVCYDDIQTAINNSTNGDTITIAAGTYTVNSTIIVDKDLTIQGVSELQTTIKTGQVSTPIFTITADGVTLRRLVLSTDLAPFGATTSEESSSLVLVNNNAQNVTITGNKLYADESSLGGMKFWTTRGITVNSGNVTISNNTIYNVRNGIIARPNTVVDIQNNRIFNTKGGIMNYTSNQADADNRTMLNNRWNSNVSGIQSHNEWDIVWNSGTTYTPTNWETEIINLSNLNNDGYVLERRGGATQGNRSHIFVDQASSISTVATANGSFNDPINTIQEATKAVAKNGKILVKQGVYNEHITIMKDLSLIGENRSNTIINGNDTGIVITILNSKVNITGFTIQKSGLNEASAGLALLNSTDSTIEKNNFNQNMFAVILLGSNNIKINNNNLTNNVYGIVLHDTQPGFGLPILNSQGNNISKNNISSNVKSGIELDENSDKNTIENNQITNNGESGIYIWHSNNNIIQDNTITKNKVAGIDIQTSINSTFLRNDIKNNNTGVLIENGWINGSSIDSNGHIFNYNNIFGNTNGVVFSKEYSTDLIDFTLNYWGSHMGPYNTNIHPSGLGDTITEDILFEEWLCEEYFSDWISQNGICKIDTPETLGWNVSSLTSDPGLNPTTIQCGGITNDNTPSHVWTKILKDDIKYQRKAKTPAGNWWTDPKAYTETNTPFVWFGNTTNGVEGVWNTTVRAWLDTNQNNIIDTNEIVSDWSNECTITYDNTAPQAPEIIFPISEQSFKTQPILNDWTNVEDVNGVSHYEIEYVYDDGHTFSNAPYRTTTVSQRNHVPMITEQGGVTIRVRAYDNAGNVSEFSNPVHYFYDATMPDVSFNGIRYIDNHLNTVDSSNTTTNDNTPTILVTASDTITEVIEVKVNGYNAIFDGTYWVTDITTALPEGLNSLSIVAKDKAGNTNTITQEIFIDTKAPTAIYTHFDDEEEIIAQIAYVKSLSQLSFTGRYFDSAPSSQLLQDSYVIFQAQDNGSFNFAQDGKISYCSWRKAPNLLTISGEDYQSTEKTPFTNCISTLPDGEYYMTHQVYDNAVRKDIPSITQFRDVLGLHFVIDSVAPDVEISNPKDDTFVRGTVDIKGTIQDTNPHHYYYKISGPANVTAKIVTEYQSITDQTIFTWDTTKYPDGEYEIRLEARDKAENKDSGSIDIIHITIDNESPEVLAVQDQDIYEGDDLPTNVTTTATDNYEIIELCYTAQNNDFGTTTDCITPDTPTNNWDVNVSDLVIDGISDYLGETITKADTSLIPEGEYNFSYYVTDIAGNKSVTESFVVTIYNVKPTSILAASSENIVEGDSVSFIASFTDPSDIGQINPDDSQWSYNLSFGDGVSVSGTTSISGIIDLFNHEYNLEGTYSAELEVCEYNANGGEGECDSKTVNILVNNNNPTISVSPILTTTTVDADPVVLSAVTSNGNSPYTYVWTGCTGVNENGTFTPTTAGTYTCTVTVTDNDSDTATANAVIVVSEGEVQGLTDTNLPTYYYASGSYEELGIGGPEDEVEEENRENDEPQEEDVKGTQTCENPKKISGYIYVDNNENSKKDNNERIFKNISLTIYTEDEDGSKTTIKEVTTDEKGYWETTLCNGDYKISINTNDLPNNYSLKNSEVLGISVTDSSEQLEVDIIVNDNRTFLQKNWIWILLAITGVTLTGYLVTSSKKRE